MSPPVTTPLVKKPQRLTVKAVKSAARKALADGRLMAQHPVKAKRQCVYVGGKDCGCAIGVALNKTTRAAIVKHDASVQPGDVINTMYLSRIRNDGLVAIEQHEYPTLRSIQGFHDAWAIAAKEHGARSDITRNAKDRFVRAIAA
jgi:hypothetical protein